jgi:DNA-binding NtrC family response regulator
MAIILAGPRTANLQVWGSWLADSGYPSSCSSSPADLLRQLAPRPTLVLLALYPASSSTWLAVAHKVRERSPRSKIVALVPESSEDLAICALRAGVHDYIRSPIAASVIAAAKSHLLHLECPSCEVPSGILGQSNSIVSLQSRLRRLASSDCNVLITGESGTGKELAAIAVHRFSSRRDAPLVCLNCAAIPDSLVESELFGYEKGAFTGADSSREGKIAAADQGVIFLDEIGDLSLFAQAKILRAVETKEIYRLGSQNSTRVNVRIVTATHRNLEQMVTAGKFRQDLFFRLNIGRIHIPPLRERIEDLGILVSHYLREINRQMGTAVRGLTEEAWHILTTYAWPGNIRELRNVVESALVNATSEVIDACDLPPHLSMATVRDLSPRERDRLVEALLATRWNKTQAAQRLHWSRMTLYRKMAKYAVSSSAQATV